MSWWVLQNLAIAACLALVAESASRQWLARRISPSIRHALWLIVLLKLVTPPIVVLTVPWTPLPAAFRAQPVLPPITASRQAQRSIGSVEHEFAAVVPAPTIEIPQATTKRDRRWMQTAATTLWIVGAILVLGGQGLRMRRMHRRVRAAADPALSADVARMAARLGVRSISVRIVAQLDSPVIWSINPFRPELLWPAVFPDIPNDTRLAFVVHELAHVKRGDQWAGWLELVASAIWWWNPLVWLARRRLREHTELACDAWVVRELPHARRSYADGLLALSAGPISPAPMPALGIRSTSSRALERRLAMIVRPGTFRVSRVSAVTLGVVGLASIPLWASPQTIMQWSPASMAMADAIAVLPSVRILSEAPPRPAAHEATRQSGAYVETAGDNHVSSSPDAQVAPASRIDLTLDDAIRASDAPESDVRQAYWELVYAIDSVESARQSLALMKSLVSVSAVKVSIGVLAPLELTLAQAEEAQREQALVLSENRRASAQARLVQLFRPAGNERLLQSTLNPIDRIAVQPQPLDVESAIRYALSSGNDIQIDRAALEAAKKAQQELNERLKRMELQAATNVTNAANRLQSVGRVVDSARRDRAEKTAALAATQEQFAAGRASQFQVIQAQRDLAAAQQKELAAQLAYRQAQAEFERVQRNPTVR